MRTLSVAGPSVLSMAEQSTPRHLRVVRDPAPQLERGSDRDEPDRAAYWARLQALRDERQRLRVG